MNSITIAGRIGQDASTRQAGENTVTKFSVADGRKVKGEEITTWWNCEIWGKRGVALEQYLTKGSMVTVVGVASIRTYQKDGETKFSADCNVNEIALQGGKQDGGNRAPSRQEPANDFADDGIPDF